MTGEEKTDTMIDNITAETTEPISVELVETNFFTRYPCTVCGGCTEKVAILAEGTQRLSDDQESRTVRVCETCLEDCDDDHLPPGFGIDYRLDLRARALEAEAALIRSLMGRLKVPTFAEWCKAERDHEVHSVMVINGIGHDEAENRVHRDYPRAPDRPLFDGNGEELPF